MNWRPPVLQTARLILRPFTDADVPAVFEYASNPKMTEYTLWETHRTTSDTELFVHSYAIGQYLEGMPDPYAIVERGQSDRPIGSVGCFWSSKPNAVMELGYSLSEPYWGRGYTAEAAVAVLAVVFDEYSVERVQARCFPENLASIRVLEKLGMMFEGTLRSVVLRRGQPCDLRMYSMLRTEWESRRRTAST